MVDHGGPPVVAENATFAPLQKLSFHSIFAQSSYPAPSPTLHAVPQRAQTGKSEYNGGCTHTRTRPPGGWRLRRTAFLQAEVDTWNRGSMSNKSICKVALAELRNHVCAPASSRAIFCGPAPTSWPSSTPVFRHSEVTFWFWTARGAIFNGMNVHFRGQVSSWAVRGYG